MNGRPGRWESPAQETQVVLPWAPRSRIDRVEATPPLDNPADPPADQAPTLTDLHVARWQAGDEAAFEVLFQRFSPLLLRRIRGHRLWSTLKGKCLAEDVAQEAWARVVAGSGQNFTPSGPGSFLAFLSTLTDRTMVDMLRSASAKKRSDGAPLRDLDTQAERQARIRPGLSGEATPTSRARISELQEIAHEVLTEREFGAWELVELQDYSASEAGLALDCSGSAVRGLLLRSRAKLMLACGNEGDG